MLQSSHTIGGFGSRRHRKFSQEEFRQDKCLFGDQCLKKKPLLASCSSRDAFVFSRRSSQRRLLSLTRNQIEPGPTAPRALSYLRCFLPALTGG